MKYLLFKTNGEVETLHTEEKFSLEKLQELVDGNIEFAPEEADGSTPMVNEDGLGLMLPRNPFFTPRHQPYYVGNVLLGKTITIAQGRDAGSRDFVGFDDDEAEKYMREPIGYKTDTFKKNTVYTLISIGDFMGQTTRSEVKATGEFWQGKPVFKENKKGARKTFTLRNLEDKEMMIFEGTDLPFKVDGEVKIETSTGFVSSTMRGNAQFNLHGDPEAIKEFIKTKNINPFFFAYDRVNHIAEDNETETLLFPEAPTDSRLIVDKREAQAKRK